VRRVVAPAALGVCHLEQPLTAGQPSGQPVFRAPDELGDAIRTTGWDVCSTASNHALDGGQEGIDFTLRRLDRLGVRHSGTASSSNASPAAILRVGDVKIAFLAYTQRIVGMPAPPNPWSVRFADAERILADARAARRAGAPVVIVNLHWGDEYEHRPSAAQRRLAETLTASPHVTAVIGQHVHVVQPIERVNGKPVVFGEGNLLSNQTAACCPAASQDGLIALLDVTAGPDGVRVPRVRYIPTWVQHPEYRIVPAPAESWQRTVRVVGRRADLRPLRGPAL
jgi:poly-gamma-glutamate capsule biosynthesis protein CapA/YwtB (metallophosphatase superfamily)